jgi:hypothetical protein
MYTFLLNGNEDRKEEGKLNRRNASKEEKKMAG